MVLAKAVARWYDREKSQGAMGMKLFLVRHGQTPSNNQKIYVGQTDVPLTETGKEQARQIRPILAKFPFDKVYTSDLIRAVHTQQLALPFDGAVHTKLLREMDVGTAAGQLYGEPFKNVSPEDKKTKGYALFGGETRAMVCDRVREFFRELEADPCEYVAAFAHNGLISCAAQVVLESESLAGKLHSPNCGIHVFEYVGGTWKILAWNYMGEIK